jgi:hypothetical protein
MNDRADIDDVLLDTAGGATGFYYYMLVKIIYTQKKSTGQTNGVIR